MMGRRFIKFGAIALCASVGLSGCGNDPANKERFSAIQNLATAVLNRGKKAPAETPLEQKIAQALASTTAPLVLFSLETSKSTGLLLEIERNRDYHTYGSADRKTIVLKRGIVTASRGFGNDMMSSDLSTSGALVRARQNGTGQRKTRFLDGEDQTFTFIFNCTVSVGKSEKMESATFKTNVKRVTEECAAGSRKITNTYMVERDGNVVASRQWFSPMLGYVTTAQLRR